MSGIACLVYSKERAMQLDAFLRSAKKYAPYDSIAVLWTASSENHAAAYDEIEDEHMTNVVGFAREGRMGVSLEDWTRISLSLHYRVVFHTDDDVFFAAPPEFRDSPEIVSYRLGENTTHCHALGRTQYVPAHAPWRWRDADGDFGYPLSLNGTVYRSADILPLLDFSFANPTELESGLAARTGRFAPEWMTAPLHSCCVSLPHNVVSSSSTCPRGANPDWQTDALCVRYLDGWRINLDAMDFSAVVGAHQEIPLEFTRAFDRVVAV